VSSRSRLSLRRPSGLFFWAAALAFTAGVLVPLIHANRFRHGIQLALENALGRRVEIGEVTLRLLTGPGFRLENVIIGEDPAFGAEPFAHVTAMQARLRLRTLWTGQIQLSSLTLQEPSLNLVKNAEGRWNFETLMLRAGPSAPGGGPAQAESAYFPYIGIDTGRVNFKFGNNKSLFHVQEVEAAISPPRDAGGRWVLRFAGRPARADHLLSGMGRLTAEGSLGAAPADGGPRVARLEVALENSPMAYLLVLIHGRDHGVHGELAGRAELTGPLSELRVKGVLNVGDMHRWDLLPSQETTVAVPFIGRLSLPEQLLRLETQSPASAEAAPRPVRVAFDLASFLTAPQWRAAVDLERAPAEPFLAVAQHFGLAWPEGLHLQGLLGGRLEFAEDLWPRGAVTLEAGELTWPNSPAVKITAASVKIAGNEFALPAAHVEVGKETMDLAASGRLHPFLVHAHVNARDVDLAALRPFVEGLQPGALGWLTGGQWQGRVTYRKDHGVPGVWSGQGLLRQADWQPAGLAFPVRISQARLRWEPGQLRVEPLAGTLGDTEFSGACWRRRHELKPDQTGCQVRVRELDLAELEQWFHPRERVSRWAALRRALVRRPADPAASWLGSLAVDGALRVDHLRAGPWEFRNVRSRAVWTEGILLLEGVRAGFGGGSLNGGLKADFTGAAPRYTLQVVAKEIDLASLAASAALPVHFQRGALEVRLGFETEGHTPQELRAALRLNGVFQAESVTLEQMLWEEGDSPGEQEIRSIEGGFTWTHAGLEITRLRMAVGREIYLGRGSIWGRPPVQFELAAGDRKARLVAAEAAAPEVAP
jgi:hypothetical protein